ncbi:GNAT family N-acetyltransferase [Kineococcus sp. DHX-1]|uniref:GNAT family N-acetyltransferase n=1 Tax=Kineococcus sp. DHX-1 TaxID=3349638 RepID=UPI0036D2D000
MSSLRPDLPPVPDRLPAGPVVLRPFRDGDVAMAVDLATDPYVPLTGSLPAHADADQALAWVRRQQGRVAEGVGYALAIADRDSDEALGQIGLWSRALDEGRLAVGYAVAPSARGRGVAAAALTALTSFAWTVPGAHRVELVVEPWNEASIRTAERAGYRREGLLRSYRDIGGRRRDLLLFARVRGDG